jgi:acyl carrier protein
MIGRYEQSFDVPLPGLARTVRLHPMPNRSPANARWRARFPVLFKPPAKPEPREPIVSIQDRVCRIVSEQMGIPLPLIQPQSRFVTDLKADPRDLVELVTAFEDEFDVDLSDSDCEGLITVGKTVAWLQQLAAREQKAAR